MIPEFPKFKKVELHDRDIISKYLCSYNPQICELNFTNIFIWREFDQPKITMINDNLCILVESLIEPPFFLEPIGKNKIVETSKICMSYAGRISRASEKYIEKIPNNMITFNCLRNQFDYIYLTEDMANFKGRKYDGKRNHIKKYYKHNPNGSFQKIDAKDKQQAMDLFEKWFAARKDSPHFTKLAYGVQKGALKQAFLHFDTLKLVGGAMFSDGVMQGFILGSKINKDTVSVHFLYTFYEVPGIYQVLLNEAAKTIFAKYKYMDLEQDLGIPGIRKSKQSYYPIKMEKKFDLKLKDNN